MWIKAKSRSSVRDLHVFRARRCPARTAQERGSPMSQGELSYLVMVIVATLAFMVVLAWASRGSSANREVPKEALPQPRFEKREAALTHSDAQSSGRAAATR